MKPLLISAIIVLGVLLAIGFDEATASSLTPSLSVPSVTVEVKFGCKLVDGQLICGKKKSSDDDADNDDQSKKKKKTGNICEGDNHCGAGETDLETPNQYKACCEPAGGFQTAPKEAEKCKFPGEVDPPNCTCPPGTEFVGFMGCVEPYCCTSYGADSDGGGSITSCGEHATAQAKVTGHLFNGKPPARFSCYVQKK